MIAIAPLRISERARWGELWSDYQTFYGVTPVDRAFEVRESEL